MKVCSFCGTKNTEDAVRCVSCSATAFENICENCGQRYAGNFCPGCGVAAAQDAKLCPECGRKYYTNACPDCGYHPGRKKETVTERVVVREVPVQTSAPAQSVPAQKSKIGCGTILLWICFPPIMATVAIIRSSMKPFWKFVLVIALWAILFKIVQ